MLEEYFKFLCNRLITWTNQVIINSGDRYVLSFENTEQVSEFMSTLEDSKKVKTVPITDSTQSKFSGLQIPLEGFPAKKLIVISTIGVTADYLVNLRNQIGRQTGVWNQAAILFVSNKILDSINSGAKDISRKGGPFNLTELHKNLTSATHDSLKLSDHEKQILTVMIQNVFEGENTFTLMDFADVYSIIEKGHIDLPDFTEMGYFYDKSLYSSNDIERQLNENHQDFEKVSLSRGFGDAQDRISKFVAGDKLVSDLAGNSWESVNYPRIQKGKEEINVGRNIKVEFLHEMFKSSNPELEIWDRPLSDTKAGSRNRQIIIFNYPVKSEIDLQLPFDQSTKTEWVSANSQKGPDWTVKGQGHGLHVNFSGLSNLQSSGAHVVYQHMKKGALKFTFNIVVFPFASANIASLMADYSLKIKSNKLSNIEIPGEMPQIILGAGANVQAVQPHSLEEIKGRQIVPGTKLQIDLDKVDFSNSDDAFSIVIDNIKVPIKLVDEDVKIIPQSAVSIEKYRREHNMDGHYQNKQVIFDENASAIFSVSKPYYDCENEFIQQNKLFSNDQSNDVSLSVYTKYQALFAELRKRRTLMSLVHWDGPIITLVRAILNQVSFEIEDTPEKLEVNSQISNLAKIGRIETEDTLEVAAFNPLLLSYQLQVETQVGSEELSETLQKKLNPAHLAPFIQIENKYFKAYYDSNAPRWLFYSESKLSTFDESSQGIVTERLKDFKKHFNYLFQTNPNSAFNIRVNNISNERLLIKGIIDYLVNEISGVLVHKQNAQEINPVNIYLENGHNRTNSDFNLFYQLRDKESFEEFFAQKFKNVKDLSPEEVIEILQSKINVFYNVDAKMSFHLTFYQFKNKLVLNQYQTDQLKINYSIHGLVGGDEYSSVQNGIKTGFGTQGLIESEKAQTLGFARCWNELLAATTNRHGIMVHGQALANSVEEIDEGTFKALFDGSKWVTLLSPEVKLDYFNQFNDDVYVIHYTDYTNSANYESITLTKKVDQYEMILSENLPDNIQSRDNSQVLTNIIKSFNVINGEWLLRLVSHRNQENTVKEKLSILAAYKELMGILKASNVTWIPISLEEILRVSGSFVGETRDSIFSAKSLSATGSISDDLLFVGLWWKDDQLKISFLPAEVKVGQNNNSVINKATTQVEKTFRIITDELLNQTFKSAFYQEFFMTLFFANAAKLYSNGEMTKEKYAELNNERIRINQGQAQIDNSLTNYYQNKVIFSLKADSVSRSIRVTDHYTLIEVPENDAFVYSGVETAQVVSGIQDGTFGFDRTRIMSKGAVQPKITNSINPSHLAAEPVVTDDEAEKVQVDQTETVYTSEMDNIDSESVSENNDDSAVSASPDESAVSDFAEDSTSTNAIEERSEPNTFSENRRFKLGTIDGSTKKAYWEFDNPQLANRHMLITGKSGQGKTYFIQTLLLELAKSHTDSLIIDYTDSYLPGQLDPILENNVGEIKQHIIMQEHLPINPFKRQKIIIGNTFAMDEKVTDLAARIAEVLDFVFNLGIQQKSRLKTVLQEGLDSNPHYTFTELKYRLQENKDDITLYGRLQSLLDSDPFTYDDTDFDWSQYFGRSQTINIIQLSGFQSSVQNALIEFLLWDLFNYSRMNTDKKLVYPVFLDEVQNLNFSKDAPTVKILREGRKFGWSGIFATQSLSSIKGEVDAVYNSAEQIHFLPPENQTKAIAKTITSDRHLQAEYETILTRLRKGQCVVNGPILNDAKQMVKTAQVINVDSLADRL